MGVLRYSSNNSGGSWWLNDKDWIALEQAGWTVEWFADRPDESMVTNGRFLGALATEATKATGDPDATIAEFESITGQDADDAGCSCCGPPHSFSYEGDDGRTRFLDSRPVEYRRSWS